jgi:hypothetical protein
MTSTVAERLAEALTSFVSEKTDADTPFTCDVTVDGQFTLLVGDHIKRLRQRVKIVVSSGHGEPLLITVAEAKEITDLGQSNLWR